MAEMNNVLLIDDEFDRWMQVLEPVGEELGYALEPAGSVEEGLEELQEYGSLYDAVILDLTFPNGGLQGKEGLQRIKEDDPQRPVLILTSSGAAEDIRTAVECVRNGAYDYFPKDRLDPQQLFLQTKQAIEQGRDGQRHQALAEHAAPETEKPFILNQKADLDGRSAQHVGHFAVTLHGLSQPRDIAEAKNAMGRALAWHHHLLNFLALSGPDVQFRLRYLVAPGADENRPDLHIALVATVEASSSEDTARRATSLYRDLMVYLMGRVQDGDRVYTFTPVTSKDRLQKWLVPVESQVGLRLSRSTIGPVAAPEETDVGFAAEASPSPEIQLPRAAEASLESTLSHFCRLMVEQQTQTLLDISLRPTKLTTGELDRLRRVARGESTGPAELSRGEDEAVTAFSEKLIQQAGRCFEIDLHLAQNQEPVSHGLKAAGINDFFGDVSDVASEQVPLEVAGGALRPQLPSSSNGERLSRLYPAEGAQRLFRLPLPTSDGLPGVRATNPVFDSMPSEVGSEGPLLGGKVVESEHREVRIHPEDMFHHVYILGQTGTGKTTMLGSMMDERLTAGAGLGLIDPHGDLCDKILRAVPDERRDDVILFDPSDPDNDVKLNLLEYDPRYPRQRTTLINELFQIFDQEYDLQQTGGPMFETYMRNALRLVMDDPEEPGTLLDAVKVFQDDIYRAELLDKCTDESVVSFWEKEAEKAGGDLSLENITPYITSKLNRFLFDEYLRSLIDVRHSTLNFRDIIDSGKILLIKMTKGKLGELGVRMFGTIIFTRLLMAALSREDLPEEERRDFFLFVDEFQNFTTPTVASMLSEARKYRLSLTLANQSLFQLKDEIVNAVLGNVGSLVTLRPGVEDYDKIGPYVTPPFEREEIINLPSYTAVARLLVDGQPSQPFTFQTIPVLDDDITDGSPDKSPDPLFS